MELSPIVNLFGDDVLKQQSRLNVTASESQALRDWIIPKYVERINSEVRKKENEFQSGCGWTDLCKFEEMCKDSANGPVCTQHTAHSTQHTVDTSSMGPSYVVIDPI